MDKKAIWLQFKQMLQEQGYDDLQQRICLDFPLADLTTMKVGGKADLFVRPQGMLEVVILHKIAHQLQIPFFVMGNSSNIVVSDEGIEGLVVYLGNSLTGIKFSVEASPPHPDSDGVYVHALAGTLLSQVAYQCGQQGLSGMEFAAGIPGSIGGAVYMNAGAYDGEMSLVVKESFVLYDSGDTGILSNKDHAFGYRKSVFSTEKHIILASVLALKPGDREEIQGKARAYNLKRQKSQPLEFPSCGSAFKRPVGHYAGGLIESAGLKGYAVGGAEVSTKHAGFIINAHQASAQDVHHLVTAIQEKIWRQFEVKLESEIKFVGRGFC